MKPQDIELLAVPGRPAVAPDGTVVVAVTNPDLALDRYVGTLWAIAGGAGRPLTFGPRDSAPVISPDGSTVVFLRAAEKGPAQLHAIDLRGGESRLLASHPLGAGVPVFSPDGRRIAYLAPVPDAGRYGTDPKISSEAEPPRRIGRMSYRRDERGFTVDKPQQVFVLELPELLEVSGPNRPTGPTDLTGNAAAEPRQLTAEPAIVGGPTFLPDGRIGYVRASVPDLPQCEIATVVADAEAAADGAASNSATPRSGELLVALPGSGTQAVCVDDVLYYLGAEFEGIDVAGRTTGLWALPVGGDSPRRMTGLDVEVDTTTWPVVLPDAVLVAVLDRGTVSLRAVPRSADRVALADLPPVLTGQHVVTAFSAGPADQDTGAVLVAAAVAEPGSPGEVTTIQVGPGGAPTGSPRRLTDLADPLRHSGIAELTELTATSPDGYPVHGFLVLPPGPGPHPVLLVVHGGPHAAYGWGLFDEAQVYAAAGYAVVLPNPRGSAGYGFDHGRTVLGRLGSVDADDVLALLDAALSRPECDADRVGVMGGSYGGFMTSWLASHAPERFTAAISERAVNAWDSFAGSSDIGYYFAENYVGATRDSQWEASPLAYADDIAVPLLIIHSEHDWRCPVEQAQRLFVALKRRGAETEMLLFPAEGHELSRSGRPQHRLQRFEAILDWWGRHLPVSGDDLG